MTDDGDSAGEPSCAGLGDERVAGGGDDDTCSGKTIGNGPTKACEGKSKCKASPAQIAANLRDAATVAALHAAGVGRDLPVDAWRIYLADFLQQAGNPADPAERVLVRQLALADQAVAHLYVRAATADDPAMSRTCFDALVKLLEAIPHLALAIRDYRGSAPPSIVRMDGEPGRPPAGDQQTTDLERGTGT